MARSRAVLLAALPRCDQRRQAQGEGAAVSQTTDLIAWFHGHPGVWLDPNHAFDLVKTRRLAARIQDAEELGHVFETRDRWHGRTHWREYRLAIPQQRELFQEARV